VADVMRNSMTATCWWITCHLCDYESPRTMDQEQSEAWWIEHFNYHANQAEQYPSFPLAAFDATWDKAAAAGQVDSRGGSEYRARLAVQIHNFYVDGKAPEL
jgi:hypothetical protein